MKTEFLPDGPALSGGVSDGSHRGVQGSRTEKLLGDVLRDALGQDQLDLDQHFVDLGGDSLVATQIMAQVSEELGTDLSPILPFEAASIRELARLIDATMHRGSP